MKYIITAALGMFVASCASTQPAAYERRSRDIKPGNYSQVNAPASPGSTFLAGRTPFNDKRAHSVGDVVIVRIEERDSAENDSSTDISRSASMDLSITGAALQKQVPTIPLTDLFGYEQSSANTGKGRIQRKQVVKATLPVRVQEVMPNGDLYVEGTKIVVVGTEKRSLYVSGVIRPIDIEQDGTVMSSRIADADITYLTEGDAHDQQRRGWLSRVLTVLWPF